MTEYLIDRHGVDKLRNYLGAVSFFKNPNIVFTRVYGRELRQVEQAWLTEAKSLGRVPPNTVFLPHTLRLSTIVFYYARYGLVAMFFLWVIRQFFRLGRSLCRLAGVWANRTEPGSGT